METEKATGQCKIRYSFCTQILDNLFLHSEAECTILLGNQIEIQNCRLQLECTDSNLPKHHLQAEDWVWVKAREGK